MRAKARTPEPERAGIALREWGPGAQEAGWLFAIALVPLLFNVHGSAPFDLAKAALLRSLALMMATIGVAHLVAARSTSPLRSVWASSAGLGAPIAAYFGVFLTSSLLSVAPVLSLWGTHERAAGAVSLAACLVLFFAVAHGLRRPEQVERLLDVFILTSMPLCAYAIAQGVGLDPIEWKRFAGDRVPSTLGNPIFAGSYLVMLLPITIGRLLDVRERERSRSIACWLALALQGIAFGFVGSRGPLLASAVALGSLALLLALTHGMRRWAAGALAVLLSVAAFLLVVNIPGGPLQSLRSSAYLFRVSHLMDPQLQDPAAHGRLLIWKGIVELAQPRPPLQDPMGHDDSLSQLRPWLGYGPETLDIVFAGVYPPEFGRSERRAPIVESRGGDERAFFAQPMPDRAHNEAFDWLAGSGWLGVLAHFTLFACVLHLALRALWRWVSPDLAAPGWGWLVAQVAGGLVLAAACIRLEPTYAAVAFPFGMAGVWLVGACRIALAAPSVAVSGAWTGVATAIVGHFIEIHLGPASITSRLCFWVLAGALAALTRVELAAVPRAVSRPERAPWLLATAMVLTLGYDFGAWPSPVAWRWWGAAIALGGVVALGVRLLFPGARLRLAWAAAPLFGFVIVDLLLQRPMLAKALDLPRLTYQLVWIFAAYALWTFALAAVLAADLAGVRDWRSLRPSHLLALAAVIALGVLPTLSEPAADALHHTAFQLRQAGLWDPALTLYQLAAERNPRQPFYLATSGEAYVEAARVTTLRTHDWRQGATQAFAAAQSTSRFDPDREASLARLSRRLAETTEEPGQRKALADAAAAHYAAALRLSPTNPILLDEAAELDFLLRGELTAAEVKLQKSMALDPDQEYTNTALGDLYVLHARADNSNAQALYRAAITYYVRAMGQRQSPKALLGMGWALMRSGENERALRTFGLALELPEARDVAWQVHALMAGLQWQQGRANAAEQHAALAVRLAPPDERGGLAERLKAERTRGRQPAS